MKVVWSRTARRQIAQAFASIAAERPSAARNWLEEIIAQVSLLETFPDMGRMVPEAKRPAIRELVVPPYRVIYRRDESRVAILTVQHQRRQRGPATLE